MTSTTSSKNVRLTISVSPEVHQTFVRLAAATGGSISKSMGDWLHDTLESAQFMADKIEQARSAPKAAMAELHAYALGLSDDTGALMARLSAGDRTPLRQRAALPQGREGSGTTSPPSSNTGGKGTPGESETPPPVKSTRRRA